MNANNKISYKMVFDKELNDDEMELVKREYQKVLSIGRMKMDSISYQLFLDKNGEVLLPKDSLIYGIEADLSVLEDISKNGILAEEFMGRVKNNFTYYCVDFYKIPSDTLLSCYDKLFVPDNMTPFNNSNNNIAFIINQSSKIGGLLYYDLFDSKFDNNPIVKNIIDRKDILNVPFNESRGKNAAILVGLPANAISGIVLGDKVLLNDELILEIKRLFPNSYIVSRKGNIIRDRSNIIRVEDFENISLQCARECVNSKILLEKNEILLNENTELKNNLLKYMNVVKNNTTNFEQAKILLDMGYSTLPHNLRNKLSDDELKILNF